MENYLNKVISGDNLEILKAFPSESIDLIYTDPPYFTQKDWHDSDGIFQFSDKWNGLEEYLNFMRHILIELHRILAKTGSLYLHVDQTASHYLKVELDRIFGMEKFRREIIWANGIAGGYKSSAANYIHASDHILYYVKGSDFTFNKIYTPLSKESIERYHLTDEDGRKYMMENRYTDKDRRYLDESLGNPIRSVWTDIHGIRSNNAEITGYPTQKPVKLLERIISISSNIGDTVLDCFCGSGTALIAAKKLDRNYIGIDKNEKAVAISKRRLAEIPNSLFATWREA